MRLVHLLLLPLFCVPALTLAGEADCDMLDSNGKCIHLNVPYNCEYVDADGNCAVYGVSIIELIANPSAYHGKRVNVTGYIVLEFESSGIFLTREMAEHASARNGLWVSFTKDRSKLKGGCTSKGYAHIQGIFNAKKHGHRSQWGGAIEDVTLCIPAS